MAHTNVAGLTDEQMLRWPKSTLIGRLRTTAEERDAAEKLLETGEQDKDIVTSQVANLEAQVAQLQQALAAQIQEKVGVQHHLAVVRHELYLAVRSGG